MINLYIVSLEPNSGKTALCLALGLHYKNKGVRVKYMKPVGTLSLARGEMVSWDSLFIKEKLGLEEPVEALNAVSLSPDSYEAMLAKPKGFWVDKVLTAHKKLDSGDGLMLLEGGRNLTQGYGLGLSASQIAPLLDAKVLLVAGYQPDLAFDEILEAYEHLKPRLIGVIINRVPQGLTKPVSDTMTRVLARYQIPVTGIIPEDSLLSSITVNELAEILGGEVICAREECDNLVENFAVGAMNTDQALSYFRRIPRKAVITGGDRPDIQIAALETDTRCLILTGNLYPTAAVLNQAAIQRVPVIIVSASTMEVVSKVDEVMGHLRLRHQNQLDRLMEIIERQQPALREFSRSLGLPV
ncbi:MAG: phosphotransacetylase family protein [Chloroflexota bacterium]